MMGVPGSFDASVYDHFDEKEQEGLWFIKHYGHIPGISIQTCNVCTGEPLPAFEDIDGLVLAGSYNSVHDHTEWQQLMREWLLQVRDARIPTLGVCGSHQLFAHLFDCEVDRVEDGPYAGTFSVELTIEGKQSPVMRSIPHKASFHYANSEHVTSIPAQATLLASSDRIPVAALDYGHHFYTTQFHPEATDETLGTIWQHKAPELRQNYHTRDHGDQLVENFLTLVRDIVTEP